MSSRVWLTTAVLLSLPAVAAVPGDDTLRPAAQKGITFLAKTALEWQTAHQGCFGCHVQAVSIEGLAVGQHHQYTVPKTELQALVDNLISGPTGIRSSGGLSPNTFPKTSRTFAGAGLARYDKYLNGKLTDDLLRVCKELLPIQRADGAVEGDHPVMGPVAAGTLQTTFQAMQAWRQCYARSADDAWRAPLRRAETFVTTTVKSWKLGGTTPAELQLQKKVALQDLNHALMALVAAGVGGTEPVTAALVKELLARQGKDGGWALGNTDHPITTNFMSYPSGESASNPLATGQTVYALRAAGQSDQDAPIARGLRWLISHQQKDGGWGNSGAAKAEAMWAVLGLVSVDVVTLSIRGVSDGDKVTAGTRVIVEAKDNTGLAVSEVSLYLDDKQVLTVKGPELSFALPALATGKHFVDAVATNAKGQLSRRRIELFSGDVFLTQLGTRFDEQKQVTEVSLRNIATSTEKGTVELEVFAQEKPEVRVSKSSTASVPGPMSLSWAGKGDDGKALPRGRYLAQLSFRNAEGKVVQTETQAFFHDSERVQRDTTGEIEGNLGLKGGGMGFAADSTVELVGDDGKVIATTRSNEAGNFRFKAVPKGTYKVRAKKEGYKDLESAPVAAEPKAAPAAASMSW